MGPVQAAPPYEFAWPTQPPRCSLYNSLCGQTVRVNRLWQVVNQCETQKRWGEEGDKKIERTKKEGGKSKRPIWLDSLARHEDASLPLCLQEKSVLNRQSRADKETVLVDLTSTFFFHVIKRPLVVPQEENLHNVNCVTRILSQIPFVNSNTNLYYFIRQLAQLFVQTGTFCNEMCLFLILPHSIMCLVLLFRPNSITERSTLICFKSV